MTHRMKLGLRLLVLFALMPGGVAWAHGGGGGHGGGHGGGGFGGGRGGGGRGGGHFGGGFRGGGHFGGGHFGGGHFHGGHFRGSPGVGLYFGPGFGWPYSPFYYPGYPYYGYGSYYYPNPVITVPSTPPVYIEKPSAASAGASSQDDWNYCTDPQGYYPYVKECPKGWQKVAAAPVGQDTGYWYYCDDPKGYYPYIRECTTAWVRKTPEPPENQSPSNPR